MMSSRSQQQQRRERQGKVNPVALARSWIQGKSHRHQQQEQPHPTMIQPPETQTLPSQAPVQADDTTESHGRGDCATHAQVGPNNQMSTASTVDKLQQH